MAAAAPQRPPLVAVGADPADEEARPVILFLLLRFLDLLLEAI